MANEISNCTDMVGQLLGERQGFTHETGNTLPQGIVKALDVIGRPGFFRDGLLLGWNYAFVNLILIRIERRLLTIYR
jgi:hypothetical protein